MHNKLLIFLTLFITPILLGIGPISMSSNIEKKILRGKIFVHSNVTDFKVDKKRKQKLDYTLAGLHKKSCSFALTKLSRYEEYKNYLSAVKDSKYDEKKQRIFLHLKSDLLNIGFILNFKLPRITKEGTYPFLFDRGFLKGLTGNITVYEHYNRCFLHIKADWEGPHSSYPNLILEMFSSTIGRIAMSRLFQISQTL